VRPGIIIQHSREVVRDDGPVRCDIVGFIAVIPPARHVGGMAPGNFIELPLARFGELAESEARHLFDAVTLHAVKQFFNNGGRVCRLFGLCIGSAEQLIVTDPNEGVMAALFDRLRGEEDIGLLAMPFLAHVPFRVVDGKVDWPVTATWLTLLRHCLEMNNRFLVIDPPQDLHDDHLESWVAEFRDEAAEAGAFGAIYYPWLMQGDTSFAPSGSVLGIYSQVENEQAPYGVRWPPANRPLAGVSHLAVPLRWADSGQLTDAHINPILSQPGRGVVIFGARTLSRDPQWVHINARRIVSMISEQLRRDNEWVVFENQRPELWQIVERTVRGRLDQLWSGGVLTGDQAGTEYEVQCDAETNPIEVRDAGQIHVRVTIRPITTTEYIVVELRLGQ